MAVQRVRRTYGKESRATTAALRQLRQGHTALQKHQRNVMADAHRLDHHHRRFMAGVLDSDNHLSRPDQTHRRGLDVLGVQRQETRRNARYACALPRLPRTRFKKCPRVQALRMQACTSVTI